ncbi:nicotinamide-nucleotide amidase [Ectothiorhodospiraceae bacterium WFHF3C12]|nr:nicotinamide-nucleotide amidase [Ectothiorhodospiraceae bacterium WFHF3C12]
MGNSEEVLQTRAREVGERLAALGIMLATAESCTGGWLSKVVTDVAGSSEWFERGFVTYSNAAKREMLGVSPKTLESHGAVSREVALEMARGAVAHRRAKVSVAITGVAGPDGGTAEKPVGTVWLAWYRTGGRMVTDEACFDGDREAVRRAAVLRALDGLLEFLQ